jgi:hypothetical protein
VSAYPPGGSLAGHEIEQRQYTAAADQRLWDDAVDRKDQSVANGPVGLPGHHDLPDKVEAAREDADSRRGSVVDPERIAEPADSIHADELARSGAAPPDGADASPIMGKYQNVLVLGPGDRQRA